MTVDFTARAVLTVACPECEALGGEPCKQGKHFGRLMWQEREGGATASHRFHRGRIMAYYNAQKAAP